LCRNGIGASIADPFVLLRLGDGALRLLRADPNDGELTVEALDLTSPAAHQHRGIPYAAGGPPGDPVTASCLFTDEDGLLSTAAAESASTAEERRGSFGGCFAFLARRSGCIEVRSSVCEFLRNMLHKGCI
jgi:hypothetical protein